MWSWAKCLTHLNICFPALWNTGDNNTSLRRLTGTNIALNKCSLLSPWIQMSINREIAKGPERDQRYVGLDNWQSPESRGNRVAAGIQKTPAYLAQSECTRWTCFSGRPFTRSHGTASRLTDPQAGCVCLLRNVSLSIPSARDSHSVF